MIIGANVFQTMARLGGIEGCEGLMTQSAYEAAVEEIFDMGYQHVELITDPLLMAFSQEELKSLMKALSKIGQRKNGKWSVHLPFWWLNIATPNEGLRQASVDLATNIIDLTRCLEPTHYVLHSLKDIARFKGGSASQALKESTLNRVINIARKSVGEIVEVLDGPRQLCIENLTNVDFQWDASISLEMDTSICFDIGHCFQRGESIFDFLEKRFERIACIHAHNVIPSVSPTRPKNWQAEDHFAMSEGLIDNQKVLQWLDAHDFSGSLIVEVRNKLEGKKSIDFLRDLNYVG